MQLNYARKYAAETRNFVLSFLRIVEENNKHWSLDELEHIMTSLDSRVTQLQEILKHGKKPTKTQKVVGLMMKLCEKGVEMDRTDVVESILDLNRDFWRWKACRVSLAMMIMLMCLHP